MSRWDSVSSDDYWDACRWPRPARDDGPRTRPTPDEQTARQTADLAHKLALGYPTTQVKIVPKPIKDIA